MNKKNQCYIIAEAGLNHNGSIKISVTEWITRHKYHVSMASLQDIPIGTKLTADMVTYCNPGTGIPAKDANKIIGKKSLKNIPINVLLNFEIFE